MSKHLRRLVTAGAALTVALALAVPALAQPADSIESRHIRPIPTTTTIPPVGTPLSVEPRCRPQVNPLSAPPIRHPFPKHDRGLAPNQDLPGAQPEVDQDLPEDQPSVDNSLPSGLTREQLRRLLLLRRLHRRICGETPPVDENRADIRVLPARGANVAVIRHPTRRDWFALVDVATDLAFLIRPGADASPEWASATSAVVAGSGVTNSLALDDRLVAQFSAPIATTVRVNDFFPAGLSTPRENTPNAPGPGGACTSNLAFISLVFNGTFDGRYKLPALNSGSLFNTNTPGGCASGANLVRTPFDDAGAGAGLNRADWTNVGFGFSPAATVVSRAVVRIVWADATTTTQVVSANPISI